MKYGVILNGKLLIGIGVWILSDGIYSWMLYARDLNYKGNRQSFWHDHWVRLVRILCGITLIIMGVLA